MRPYRLESRTPAGLWMLVATFRTAYDAAAYVSTFFYGGVGGRYRILDSKGWVVEGG